MAAIQVKDFPNELHDALKARAARHGVTMSEYIVTVLRRDLSKPSLKEWLDEMATREPAALGVDIVEELHAARGERDEELDAATHRR